LALSARVSATLPGSSVPQSAQTLAVLVVGGLFGSRDGTLTVLAYLLAGGAGAPIFADGASGWTHLAGPTAGYLLGFVLAAAGIGLLADHRLLQRPASALGAMVGGHVLILGLGWTRLAWILGPEDALRQGVTPFVAGGCIKSLIAATVVVAVYRLQPANGASAGRGRVARSRDHGRHP
ncbi:MAG: biotin transporter BioY, partial [Gemmatimonadota bacterium]